MALQVSSEDFTSSGIINTVANLSLALIALLVIQF